ncbi:MAG: DUF2188 domain-containing protein [Firmicutes bacterium]|nr:DUF2188 domain-containing protein [Bacillota bacterium]
MTFASNFLSEYWLFFVIVGSIIMFLIVGYTLYNVITRRVANPSRNKKAPSNTEEMKDNTHSSNENDEFSSLQNINKEEDSSSVEKETDEEEEIDLPDSKIEDENIDSLLGKNIESSLIEKPLEQLNPKNDSNSDTIIEDLSTSKPQASITEPEKPKPIEKPPVVFWSEKKEKEEALKSAEKDPSEKPPVVFWSEKKEKEDALKSSEKEASAKPPVAFWSEKREKEDAQKSAEKESSAKPPVAFWSEKKEKEKSQEILEDESDESNNNSHDSNEENDETENSEKGEKKKLGKYHVLFQKNEQNWCVKREGSTKILRVLETQNEAIAWATIKSIGQNTTFIVHRKDGKIRKQNYSK